MKSLTAAALLLCAATAAPPSLPDLCTFEGFTFHVYHGSGSHLLTPPNATSPCAYLEMWSTSASEGAAASFDSAPFPVRALGVYNVSLQFSSRGLTPLSAYLTGGFYVSYTDANNVASGWAPAYGSLAPTDSSGYAATLSFTPPTTAARAVLHVAFAAHEFGYTPNRMEGGAATGAVAVAGSPGGIADTGATRVAPSPPLRVPAAQEPALAALLDLAAQCLFNSQLGGNFTVGSDYDISGNMSPDMMWGAFGARRAGVPAFADTMRAQWERFGGLFDPATGRLTSQERFMAQVLFPLGVDELFSFSGNVSWLRAWLPVADASFSYLASISDARGYVVPPPADLVGRAPGVDWVDWYPTRALGPTFTLQAWHVRALRRAAALHDEFGSPARAAEYRARADAVVAHAQQPVANGGYWNGRYFITNVNISGRPSDEGIWQDDQLNAIFVGIATPAQTATIYAWVDASPVFWEGVASRWGNLSISRPSERFAETWFGRLGAIAILGRYAQGQAEHGLALLRSFASAAAATKDIYESYTMRGAIGGDRGADYLEHCGGSYLAALGGPFGVSFDSDAGAAATVAPAFPATWPAARAHFVLRGTLVCVDLGAGRALAVTAHGAPQRVRVVWAGSERVIVVGGDAPTVCE
jgi:hypothetical protein